VGFSETCLLVQPRLFNLVTAAGRGLYFFNPAISWEGTMPVFVCMCETTQKAKVSLANVLRCRVWNPKMIQTGHQDWTGIGRGRGAEGSEDVSTVLHVQSFHGAPFVLSLNVQGITFFQAKAGLVLVKKALQGLNIHCMVQIHHLISWILNFWHCDWFPNYGGDWLAIWYDAPRVAKDEATSMENARGKA